MMSRTVKQKFLPIVLLTNVLQTTGMSLTAVGGYLQSLQDADELGGFREKRTIKQARDEIEIASAALDAYESVVAENVTERA